MDDIEPGTLVRFTGGPLRLHKLPEFRSGMLADTYVHFGDIGYYHSCIIERLRMHIIRVRKNEEELGYAICYYNWFTTGELTEEMRNRNDASQYDHAYSGWNGVVDTLVNPEQASAMDVEALFADAIEIEMPS